MNQVTTGPIDNAKHEAFAQLIALGRSATEAYTEVYGPTKGAEAAASRLLRKIKDRVRELQGASATVTVLSLQEKREILAGIARARPDDAKSDSDLVDRQMSAIVARNQQSANPTKIWNPHLTQEGEEDENLKFSPGQTYTAKDSSTSPTDILTFIEMPDLDERTWQLVEFFMQLIQVESGVTNANQGDVSSLPTNTTATGINSMLESSSVIHSYSLDELRDALEPALRYAVELIYFRQDVDETFEYFEGAAKEVLSLSDATVLRKMPINVRILLQRSKRIEMRQAALDTLPHAQGFFKLIQVDPLAAKRLRPLYIQVLRGYEIDGADDVFPTADEIDEIAAARALATAQQPTTQSGEPPAAAAA